LGGLFRCAALDREHLNKHIAIMKAPTPQSENAEFAVFGLEKGLAAPADGQPKVAWVQDRRKKKPRQIAATQIGSFLGLSASASRLVGKGRIPLMDSSIVERVYASRLSLDEMDTFVVPRRILARRIKASEPLTEDETNRVLRIDRVICEADRVFGSSEKADRWLRYPNPKLGDKTPLSMTRSDAGARVIEEMLAQIDHGMFA
jgi:putative toxin-antitoxin system antitoxin component (TIGR02293 family)